MHSTNITDKNYKKLVIQVSLNGLSFACLDTITNKAFTLESITIDNFEKNVRIEDVFTQSFSKYPELQSKYDEILIIHSNNLCTFVPKALFDEEYLGSYLQFNTKVFETDFFAFDEIPNYEMNTVYIPYVNLNNFFIDQFGTFDYKHANTILVEKLLDLSKNNDARKMFIHVSENHFEMVVLQNQKLELYNSFEYKTPEDFMYYILFVAEQLHLNPENFQLELLGKINEESPLFKIAYKYIRNVKLFENTTANNYFSAEKNREYYILL